MKSERGITLITLIVTLVVMIILIATMAVNFAPYKSEMARTSLEEDITALGEGVEQYYARYKKLPVINRYTYTLSFQSSKNVNDNEKYYIIDIRELDVNLHLGYDFYQALARERSEEINDLLDLYIINEGSHTIYYPKGIEYNDELHYTTFEEYNSVKEKVKDTVSPVVNITFSKSEKLFGVVATIEISDAFSEVDLKKCKYTFSKSQEKLGINESNYKYKIYNSTTNIEQVLAPSENWYLHVLAEDKAGNKIEVVSENGVEVDSTAEFPYTGDVQTADLLPGKYQIECWGASGGSYANYQQHSSGVTTVNGGKGAYTSGNITLNESKQLYVYVGEIGKNNQKTYSFNGGGSGGNTIGHSGSGGGATDIRLANGNWDSFDSLKTRIMVAAGGGAPYGYGYGGTGGNGGGLTGYKGTVGTKTEEEDASEGGLGATQTSGGAGGTGVDSSGHGPGNPGTFGIGGSNTFTYGSGAGGGYYGGGSGGAKSTRGGAAGGGSSFISGHSGCDAIKEESTENNIVHLGDSRHYSEYVFTNTVMIDGGGYKWTNEKGEEQKMPKPEGGKYDFREGHTGDGYARITNLN